VDARLEQIILSLVKQHAPQLLGGAESLGATREERLERLCRRLANHGILVLAVEVVGMSGNPALVQTQNWVSGVARLYSTLVRRLFPSYARIDTQYIDGDMPAVITIMGDSNILMQKMAGFVLPYLALRQTQVISEAELRGLVDIVLEELEANDLPRTDYQTLRAECVTMLQRLLSSPMRLLALRTFDRPIFFGGQEAPARVTGTQSIVPPTLPTEIPVPPKPAIQTMPVAEVKRATGTFAVIQPDRPKVLPETGKLVSSPKPAPQETGVVLPRNPTAPTRGETGKLRRPPVPPLPDDKK
jgi:hypothetical protein